MCAQENEENVVDEAFVMLDEQVCVGDVLVDVV